MSTTPKSKSIAKVVKKTRKATSTKKKALDTKNIKDTVKQAVKVVREIKYKYPPEIDNTLDKKAWRQKVRNKLRKYERDLAKATGKEKIKLNKEYKAYRQEVLMVP